MTLYEVLESCGVKRPKVQREIGESEELVNGKWVKRNDLMDDYVRLRFRAKRETGMSSAIYLFNDTHFGIELPIQKSTEIMKLFPELSLLVDADDCRVFKFPFALLTPKLIKHLKIERWGGRDFDDLTPEEQERLLKQAADNLPALLNRPSDETKPPQG